jgi:hypothetical protein
MHVTGPTWVMLENVPGARADIRAKVVDFNETGIRIHVSLLLQAHHVVVVKAQAPDVVPNGRATARVVDCRALTGSGYTVGLTFEKTSNREEHPKPAMDHYEVLQVSRHAEPETIHSVYRFHAQRLHPDNGETGDSEAFRAVTEAYKVLGDPQQRAVYDVGLESHRKSRWPVVSRKESAAGKEAEKLKRRAILDLLYTARRSQASQATVSIYDLEDRLGCQREHLDFSLWYLKESALIVSSEFGRYSITPKGVDQVEAEDHVPSATGRLLAAGE